jgi:O-antigen ligase
MDGLFTGKNYWFYISIAILLSFNVLYYLFDISPKKLLFNRIDFFFLSFVIWSLFSGAYSQPNIINEDTSELFLLTIFFFIVKIELSDPQKHQFFFKITTIFFLVISSIESLVGILQLYSIIQSNNPYFKVTGTFVNPTPFGLFLCIAFVFGLTVFTLQGFSNKVIKYMALVSCILIVFILPFSLNRASWIGVLAGILIIGLYKLIQLKHVYTVGVRKKVGIVGVIILICISGVFLYHFKKDSSDGRMLIWKVSGNIIKEHPLAGIGYGRFHSEYNLWQADYFKKNLNKNEVFLAGDVKLAYNDYIEIFAETGLVGLFFFFGLVYTILYYLKLQEELLNAFIFPLVICLILSVVSYPLNSLTTKILFFFFIASLSGIVSKYENNTAGLKLRKWVSFSILTISIAVATVFIIKYQNYKTWLFASKEYIAGNYEISEEYYHQIYKPLQYDLFFSLQYAECLYKRHKYTEVLDVLNAVKEINPDLELNILMGNAYKKTGQYAKAKTCYEQAGYMVPGRVLPKYFLTSLYFEKGDTLEAIVLSNEILTMPIKIKSDTTQALINEIKKRLGNYKDKHPDEGARVGASM